jgi:hypothetical protein
MGIRPLVITVIPRDHCFSQQAFSLAVIYTRFDQLCENVTRLVKWTIMGRLCKFLRKLFNDSQLLVGHLARSFILDDPIMLEAGLEFSIIAVLLTIDTQLSIEYHHPEIA